MSSFLERWRQQKNAAGGPERIEPSGAVADSGTAAAADDDNGEGRTHARRPVYRPPSETSSLPIRRAAGGVGKRRKPTGTPIGIVLAAPVGNEKLKLKLPGLSAAVQGMTDDPGATFDATPRTSRVYQRHRLLSDSSLAERYGEFSSRAIADGLHDIEQLVPSLTLPPGTAALVARAADRTQAEATALSQALPPGRWPLPIPLSATQTTQGPLPVLNEAQAMVWHRLRFRLDFMLTAVAGLWGGRLDGRRVLDVGGGGVFALEAALRGASEAVAYDPRPAYNHQMQQLAQYYGTTAPRFLPQPPDGSDSPPFDVVMHLGTLFRSADPIALVRQAYDQTRCVAVFEGPLYREAVSTFLLGQNADGAPVLRPTYRGLIDLLHMVGFKEVIEICGTPPADWADFAKDGYGSGSARCLIAVKDDL